jgi:hypothetical protein
VFNKSVCLSLLQVISRKNIVHIRRCYIIEKASLLWIFNRHDNCFFEKTLRILQTLYAFPFDIWTTTNYIPVALDKESRLWDTAIQNILPYYMNNLCHILYLSNVSAKLRISADSKDGSRGFCLQFFTTIGCHCNLERQKKYEKQKTCAWKFYFQTKHRTIMHND